MRVKMHKELTLLIPDSLFSDLESRAKEQRVSVEALCFSLLSGNEFSDGLVEPQFYSSLNHETMRKEVGKVLESSLPPQEIRRRINKLEFEISRRYIR